MADVLSVAGDIAGAGAALAGLTLVFLGATPRATSRQRPLPKPRAVCIRRIHPLVNRMFVGPGWQMALQRAPCLMGRRRAYPRLSDCSDRCVADGSGHKVMGPI